MYAPLSGHVIFHYCLYSAPLLLLFIRFVYEAGGNQGLLASHDLDL